MTALADLIGGLGTGLVFGRAQSDHATVEVAAFYRDQPIFQGIRLPHMVLSEVTIEVRFATQAVSAERVDVLVTAEEMATVRLDQLNTLTLKFTEDDIEPPTPAPS